MKFQHKITLSLLLTIVLCGVAFAQVVEIPDPNLRAAVREALNLPVGASVTRAGMQQLTRLDAANRQVKNLTGLEHATSLTYLALQNNDISDLRALTPLANLTFLRLHGNQINDISPLANLTELTTLPLDSNDITNIGPLANLNKLTALALGDNNITDLSPLANLTGLMHLVLSNNNITDVSPLANLANLKHLELQNNSITDITPLENLTNLEHLDTQNNPIFDADSPVVEIPDPNLRAAIRKTLMLSDDVPVTRAAMQQMKRFGVKGGQIKDLTGLEHATSLMWIALNVNKISDLRPLANLTRLTYLDLNDNDIVEISPLANLTELTQLLLRNNNIMDVTPLANLTNLKHLELQDNRVTDVSPLANLTSLRYLELQDNSIIDHQPLDQLSFTTFIYDEICEMPPLPLQPRLQNRTYPSIFSDWGHVGGVPILNRPESSDIEIMAAHDLWFSNEKFGLDFRKTSQGIKILGATSKIDAAIEMRNQFYTINPNMIYLVELKFRHGDLGDYPVHWPYWLRDAQGKRVNVRDESEIFLIDFTHPGFQDEIVEQTVALEECGLYDGILFDWWYERRALLVSHNPYTVYRGLEAELEARIKILQRIRAATRPDFLIMVNTNDRILPITGSFINGSFMESFLPHTHIGDELEDRVNRAETALTWHEANMRQPRINGLAGGTNINLAPDDPYNLRWMRAVTTLSLTHSDGYVTFNIGNIESMGYWYDFWDADLGRPVGEKRQLYDKKVSGLYIREFTNGWAVYNHSGGVQEITLPEIVTGVASGVEGITHTLPNYDGEMYLRAKPANPADVNGDGVVNILDLTLVAQALGTDSLKGDVNGDGVVNVFDLVFVAGELQ